MNIQHALEEVISLDSWMPSKGYASAKDSRNVSQITGTTWPPNRSTAVSEAAPRNQPTHHPLVLHRIPKRSTLVKPVLRWAAWAAWATLAAVARGTDRPGRGPSEGGGALHLPSDGHT